MRFQSFDNFRLHVKNQFEGREERLVIRKKKPYAKEAAILFLLIFPENHKINDGQITDNIFLLLEKRASFLKQNPGDMAFPGGRVEKDDENLIETAYREASEEVGVDSEQLNFIACMDEFVSNNGIIVRSVISSLEMDIPIQGFREEVEKRFAPKTSETENTVVIPLSHCLDPQNYMSTEFQFNGSNRGVGYVRYINIDKFLKGHHIWGLTASMIRRFIDIVFPDNPLPEEPIKA